MKYIFYTALLIITLLTFQQNAFCQNDTTSNYHIFPPHSKTDYSNDTILLNYNSETLDTIEESNHIFPVSIRSRQELSEDSLLILAQEECPFCAVDRLDSLLQTWFYYSGRDTIEFLNQEARNNVITDLADSVYEERLRLIISPVELSYNKVVQKYIDTYVKNGKWYAPKILGLSMQFFPIFEQYLDANNMPLELKYLSIVESGLNPIAKSVSGAAGLWQFMYQTAKGFGLEINSYVDERMDIIKSTQTACLYLKKLFQTYNDWILTIAAYNCGPGAVNNAIRRAGGRTNYWDLYPFLPYETRNYVPRFIAITYLFEYYKEHNFKPEPYPFFVDIDTVMVRNELHFAQLDSILGISVEQSRELNPQYRHDIIPAKTKSYPLRIRHQYVAKFIELEDSIYSFNDSVFFNPNKYYYKPNESYDADFPLAAQPANTTELQYTVKSGDVIGLIAEWYGVRNNEIKAWNGCGSNLRIGQVLKIYVPNDKVNKYKNINSMSFEEKQKSVGVDAKTNKPIEEPLDPNYEYYVVQQGDIPGTIAKKLGITIDDILKLNDIDPTKLRIGQKLKIRKK
jgi:membrane-bound lytic murein transglycosylase D